MSASKTTFTSQELAVRYGVNPDTIRTLVDRMGLGHRAAHWRIIPITDLGRLEDGLRALGYKIPPVEEAV